VNKELLAPVLSFKTGEFINQCVKLDHDIFNLPLRRDIVHRVYMYEFNKGRFNSYAAKTLTTVVQV